MAELKLRTVGGSEYKGELTQEQLEKFITAICERKRSGHWVRIGESGYCSICKHDMPLFREDWDKWEYCETPYCPHCGAKMEDEDE